MLHRGKIVTGMYGGKERRTSECLRRLPGQRESTSGKRVVITTGVGGIGRCEYDSDLASLFSS